MRPCFRDKIEKLLSFSRLTILLDTEAQPKKNALGRGQDEAEPLLPFQGPDMGFLPRIEDFGLERDADGRGRKGQEEGQRGLP